MASSKQSGHDLRRLTAAERLARGIKPTSGQSRPEFSLPTSDLKRHEVRLLECLNGAARGLREAYPVAVISKATRMTPLEVRNTIRRLVPSTWVERVDEVLDDAGATRTVRGYYRITERGRKRLASAG